jgi:hypothetical protein
MPVETSEKKLNVLFVCERGQPPFEYLKELASRGHSFRQFTDMDRALDECNRKPFDFGLVVIDLPQYKRGEETGANGPGAAERILLAIRKSSGANNTPVILMTGNTPTSRAISSFGNVEKKNEPLSPQGFADLAEKLVNAGRTKSL